MLHLKTSVGLFNKTTLYCVVPSCSTTTAIREPNFYVKAFFHRKSLL